MRVSELIEALHKYQGNEVVVKVGNGLFCPINGLDLVGNCIVIVGEDVRASVKEADFEQPKYEPYVKTVYIIDNNK